MTRSVTLAGGGIALVDDADHSTVIAAGPWFEYQPKDRATTYARRNTHLRGIRTTEYLHIFLMQQPNVDHINLDGLDNRRANLRLATRAQNNRNRRLQRNNTSGFKGVVKAERGRWKAQISIDGRVRNLGRFDSPEEAARAYDTAAHQHYGEFARPNFDTERELL